MPTVTSLELGWNAFRRAPALAIGAPLAFVGGAIAAAVGFVGPVGLMLAAILGVVPLPIKTPGQRS